MWIEKRGRQHRVYYRNPLPEKPKNRDNVVFYAEADARGSSTSPASSAWPPRSP